MKRVLLLSSIFIFAFAASVYAQVPVSEIDLQADSMYVTFPSPGAIAVTVEYTLFNATTTGFTYNSEIKFVGDGYTLKVDPVVYQSDVINCQWDPNCSGSCPVQVNGEWKQGQCHQWTTWTGAGCNPYNPPSTCMGMLHCACKTVIIYEVELDEATLDMLAVHLDPFDRIFEADETNNIFTMQVGDVPIEKTTWGKVKELYRQL
jgi:hypothetical protein